MQALRIIEKLDKRNYVEHVFGSFKFIAQRFNNCLCINLRKVIYVLFGML